MTRTNRSKTYADGHRTACTWALCLAHSGRELPWWVISHAQLNWRVGPDFILHLVSYKLDGADFGRGVKCAIRLPTNENLEWDVFELLPRPVGRPGVKPLVEYKSFLYQAASWKTTRRAVARVEHHLGERFSRVGFLMTNSILPSRAALRFYDKRGTAEQWIKEGKLVVNWTRLSCREVQANEGRLQLSVVAYNLGELWRQLGLPQRIKSWSLMFIKPRSSSRFSMPQENC